MAPARAGDAIFLMRPLRAVPPDEADHLAHMRIVAPVELVPGGAQYHDDPAARCMADALARTGPPEADLPALRRIEPVLDLLRTHVHRVVEGAVELVVIVLQAPLIASRWQASPRWCR